LSPLTTSITISSNKFQNGDILVPANPGSPGKWPLKRQRERELVKQKPKIVIEVAAAVIEATSKNAVVLIRLQMTSKSEVAEFGQGPFQ